MKLKFAVNRGPVGQEGFVNIPRSAAYRACSGSNSRQNASMNDSEGGGVVAECSRADLNDIYMNIASRRQPQGVISDSQNI